MIAIVVPYYKLRFFKFTLDSLSNQTNKDFVVYIGNDCSPEDPRSLLSTYQNKFDYVYKNFDENLGQTSLVAHWNRCISMINNEDWVMILGDDDVLSNNVVEEFYNVSPNLNKQINVLRYASVKINDRGDKTSEIYYHPTLEKGTSFLFRDTRSSLSEYIFKRSKIVSIGFKELPLAWNSDVLAVLEFSDFGEIYTINNSSLQIRISDCSISGMNDNFLLKSNATFKFYYYLLSRYQKKFSKDQKNNLFKRLLKLYLNDKKNVMKLIRLIQIKLKLVTNA